MSISPSTIFSVIVAVEALPLGAALGFAGLLELDETGSVEEVEAMIGIDLKVVLTNGADEKAIQTCNVPEVSLRAYQTRSRISDQIRGMVSVDIILRSQVYIELRRSNI